MLPFYAMCVWIASLLIVIACAAFSTEDEQPTDPTAGEWTDSDEQWARFEYEATH